MTTTTELEQKLEKLEHENEVLKARIAANKSAPEFSAFFVNAKDRTPIKWNHLSETKRFFEQKHQELLTSLLDDEATATSKEFHEALIKALTQ